MVFIPKKKLISAFSPFNCREIIDAVELKTGCLIVFLSGLLRMEQMVQVTCCEETNLPVGLRPALPIYA